MDVHRVLASSCSCAVSTWLLRDPEPSWKVGRVQGVLLEVSRNKQRSTAGNWLVPNMQEASRFTLMLRVLRVLLHAACSNGFTEH